MSLILYAYWIVNIILLRKLEFYEILYIIFWDVIVSYLRNNTTGLKD
jgi:hypothetical protein